MCPLPRPRRMKFYAELTDPARLCCYRGERGRGHGRDAGGGAGGAVRRRHPPHRLHLAGGHGRRQGHLPDGAHQAGRGGPSLPRFGPGAGVGGAAERQRLQELEKERLVPPPGAAGGGPAPGGGGAGAGGRRAAGPGGPAAGSQTANTPAACGGPGGLRGAGAGTGKLSGRSRRDRAGDPLLPGGGGGGGEPLPAGAGGGTPQGGRGVPLPHRRGLSAGWDAHCAGECFYQRGGAGRGGGAALPPAGIRRRQEEAAAGVLLL